jgi:hypothetical protein
VDSLNFEPPTQHHTNLYGRECNPKTNSLVYSDCTRFLIETSQNLEVLLHVEHLSHNDQAWLVKDRLFIGDLPL